MKRDLGIAAELVKGDRGIFDVRADGALIYSKKRDCGGRFPTDAEIVNILRARS